MKYLWLMLPLLFVGCSSVRYVTVIHGQMLTQDRKPLSVTGNPPMICHSDNSNVYYSGYFIRQEDDGTVLLDHFGKETYFLSGNLICELKLDASQDKESR